MPLINLDGAKTAAEEVKRISGTDPLNLYRMLDKEHMSLSQYLETLDPSARDEAGRIANGFDALQRYLMVNDIKLSGPNSTSLKKLMESSNVAILPELVRREVIAGMTSDVRTNYKQLIAATVPADGATYHPLYIPELDIESAKTRRDKSLGKRASIGKGGEFPVTSLRHREKDIVVGDYGRQIEAPYSYLSNKSWPEISIFLQLIGAQIAMDMMYDIWFIIHNGDGIAPAGADTFAGTAGTLAYTDIMRCYTTFTAPFTMNALICPQTAEEAILSMSQFQDPMAGWRFQNTGEPVTPMGAAIKRVGATPAGTPTATVICALDRRFAIREVSGGELMVEAEKIISRKFEKAVVSQESAFCLIASGAVKQIIYT